MSTVTAYPDDRGQLHTTATECAEANVRIRLDRYMAQHVASGYYREHGTQFAHFLSQHGRFVRELLDKFDVEQVDQ